MGINMKHLRMLPTLLALAITAAGGSVYAHLLDLQKRGLVEQVGDTWKAA
jgi:hypothetical protein